MRRTLRDRLLSRLYPCADNACQCLLWTGHVNPRGYGLIYTGEREEPVHRVMFEMFDGPIPEGLHLDHVRDRGCKHRNCCNVAHLEPVTCAENNRRAAAAVTHCPAGHEYTPDNTRIERRRYSRHCVACQREARRAA